MITSLMSAFASGFFGLGVTWGVHWSSGETIVTDSIGGVASTSYTNNTGAAQVVAVTMQTTCKELVIAPDSYIKVAVSVNRTNIEAVSQWTHAMAFAMGNTGTSPLTYRPSPMMYVDYLIVPPGETITYQARTHALHVNGVVQHVGLSYSTIVIVPVMQVGAQ